MHYKDLQSIARVGYCILDPGFSLVLDGLWCGKFVCYLFNVTSLLNICLIYHIPTVPTCSSSTLINVMPHRNAMPQTPDIHDTPSSQSLQTQGLPVVLSIDVARHTGIHNYPFKCLGSDPMGKSFPDLPHTSHAYDTVVVSWKLGRKCTVSDAGKVLEWIKLIYCYKYLLFSSSDMGYVETSGQLNYQHGL